MAASDLAATSDATVLVRASSPATLLGTNNADDSLGSPMHPTPAHLPPIARNPMFNHYDSDHTEGDSSNSNRSTGDWSECDLFNVESPDPLRVELYNHHFTAIAKQLAARLRQKRPLGQHQCAVRSLLLPLRPPGVAWLMASAPHISVHPESIGEARGLYWRRSVTGNTRTCTGEM